MDNVRLVNASLAIAFDEGDETHTPFMQEYHALLMLNDDPLSVWLKSDKIRKESEDTDKVLLTLIAELHRKIDDLTQKMSTSGPLHLELRYKERIEAIGFGHILLSNDILKEGQCYYARIDMPTFPRRTIPLFFEALSLRMGRIVRMHKDDERDWSAYMMASERVMIREKKGASGEH